jgi:hypothetical protein
MSMTNIATAAATLRDKLTAAKGADRGDLYLADAVPVNASSAKLLIGYVPRFGTPNHSQVANFVTAMTSRFSKSGALKPELESLTDHPVNSVQAAVSLIVNAPSLTATPDHKDHMVAVSSTMFYDNKIGANWELKANAAGAQFLECMRKENVPELLQTAIASQGIISKTLTFQSPELQAVAAVQCNVGDYVEFWAEGGLRRGDVTKCEGDEVVIDSEDRPLKVSRAAVTKIIRLNQKAANEEKKRLVAFYSTIWGPEYAKDLVDEQ